MIFFPSNEDNSRHTGFMSVSRDSQGMPLNTGYRPGNASTRQTIISACAPVDVGFAAPVARSFVSVATIARALATYIRGHEVAGYEQIFHDRSVSSIASAAIAREPRITRVLANRSI